MTMANRKKKTPTANAGTKSRERLVIHQIVVKAPQRKVYDVGNWRTALSSADNGRTKQLYDLLDDIMIDGVLSDAVQKRIDAVTNSELTFQNADGEEVEEIALLMDTTAWEELLTEIMKKKIYGRSGVEMTFNDGFNVEPIPAKHINLKNRTILRQDTDETGIPYEGDSQLLILGKDRDFGLLLKAAPYAIYKRGGFGDWSQWIELFGMPQRIGKYNTYDPESRKLLEEAFEKAGSAPYVVIPKEADVETKDGGTGSGDSYNEFRQANNEEMLITILGQTMTTVQGEKGARSLGEVHKEVEEGKNKSDLRYVQRVLNQKVLPMLEARGYPVTGGKFVFPKAAEQLSVAEVVQLSDIMDIPQSYLHEKYSIPVPKDGEPVAKRASAGTVQLDTGEDPEEDTISNADRNFLMRLWDFFVKAPRDGASGGKARIRLNDDATLDGRVIARVAGGDSAYFDAELFQYISSDLLDAVQKAFKRTVNHADVRFAYGLQDDAFITALEQNLFHFSAAKTLAEVQELNRMFRESKNFEEFSKKAAEICGTFNRTWQKTEYETAVLTAESASNYHRLMGKTKLFPYWKYVTAGDDKVREEHRKLDGVVLPAKDTRWDKIFPPNGWKCRCRVTPVMRHEVSEEWLAESSRIVDGYLGTSEWRKVEQQHWDSNRGKRAEIFDKDQMYIRKFPDMAARYMDKIPPAGWGVEPSFKKLTGEKAPELKEYGGTAESWWNDRKKVMDGKDVLPVTDYRGRIWYMEKKDYDIHTTDDKKSRGFRVKYLSCIDEVMADPDEVWLGSEYKDRENPESRLNNWILIKYYKGVAVACVCKIEKRKMVFKSWYEVRNPKIRKGILVRKRQVSHGRPVHD